MCNPRYNVFQTGVLAKKKMRVSEESMEEASQGGEDENSAGENEHGGNGSGHVREFRTRFGRLAGRPQ